MTERLVLNTAILIGLIGDDAKALASFQSEFLNQSIQSLKLIAQSYNQVDFVAVKEHAHYLKTSAKAVGAERCADCLQQIEKAALANSRAELKPLIVQLQMEIKQVKQLLNC